ncbi:MAG TPA: glycosyltransferase family 39 protein [Candidatus Dormibacteraeota bacterium]|nr:glycosyltransferase family 39 protein [Candidatus Dormibacteraeota bacterium]
MPQQRQSAGSDAGVLGAIAALDVAIHLALAGRYGYWIDELYFIACGAHLDWGYVDHPPLIAAVAAAARWLFGDSLVGLRLPAALAGGLLVFLTGWIARALGGGRTAQIVAAVAALVAPVYLAFAAVLTMNGFEPLFWMGAAYLAIRIAQGASPRRWVLVGVCLGLGLLNKHSTLFFGAALFAGLLLSPQRRLLASPWPWVGGLIALAIALPNLLWERAHGWPTAELLANAHRYQHQPVTPLQFVFGQIQIVHPFTVPLWIAGVWFLVVDPRAARVRFLGWTFALLFVTFLAAQAKTYYLAPIYPIAFAGGGVVVETLARRGGRRWVAPAVLVVLVLGGLVTAPYALPVLPVSALPTYLGLLGMREVRPETRPMGNVPQIFADMLGWEDLVAEIARVYHALPPADRTRAVIWGRDYGVAGAVDLFGRRQGLPAAVSGAQNYFLWGPGERSGEVMIAVSFPEEVLRPWFGHVELAGQVRCPYCMPDRQLQRIYVCRDPVRPLADFWPLTKCWTCDRPPFAKGRGR